MTAVTAKPGTPLGVLLHGSMPVGEIARMARRIEQAGFQSLWFGEDYFLAGGFSSAAIALQATERLHVGLGVVATVARHPAVLAMEAATLAGAFPGRFTLGVGHGVPAWMQQMNLYPKSPLGAMRECLIAARRLLDGETVNSEGSYFSFREVVLQHKAPELAILAGVVGPKSIRVAIEHAQGLIASALSGPEYVRHAKKLMTEAAEAVGRAVEPQLPVYAFCSLDHDRAKARGALREISAHYLGAMGATDMTGCYGVNDQLKDMLARGGEAIIASEMPDEWVDWLGISGTPEDCRAQIGRLVEAGATSVVLAFVPQLPFDQQLDLASRELLPHFR